MAQPSILDLGCGNRKRAGAIGVDSNPRSDADVIHDLNVLPYPFAESSFDEIYLDNVLEHLQDVVAVVEELYRIAKPNGLVRVIVPYFRARWAFIDPTHRHFFTVQSFSYFDPEHIHCKLYDYSTARFRLASLRFNLTVRRGWLTEAVKLVANRWPDRYERFLSHLYPLDDLTFDLRAVK